MELLKKALDQLPPTLRSAVLLRDIQELSYQEIADRLHLPEGTVKSRINRGRTELARQIRRLRDELETGSATAGGLESQDESDHRTDHRRRDRARRRATHDVSAAGGLLRRRRPVAGLGPSQVLLDFSKVTYVDSATIGCLMDLYRQTTAAGGAIKLAGVQKRVETMLTMTGAHNFLEMHPDEASAVRSFGG